MNRIFYFALVSTLTGFLFGFDTVVISGAEQTIQKLWGLSPGLHGVAMAAALYGTVISALLGGWPTDRFGLPKMVTAFAPGQVFWFFCGMMVLQLVWIKLMVPETKGVPLEDMQRKLGIR